MASPYITSQRPPAERPWLGMAMLVAVPLLALILIRMLWSGSGLWFLTVGIILLGVSAVIFLARRPQERDYGPSTLTQEPNRLPLVLAGLGVVFLAMLLLPNFAGGDSNSSPAITSQQPALSSDVSGAVQPPVSQAQPTAQVQLPQAQQPLAEDPPASSLDEDLPLADGETYIVQDGDTLWDIATRFGASVDAIIAANSLENADDLAIGDELTIPAGSEEAAPVEEEAPVGAE